MKEASGENSAVSSWTIFLLLSLFSSLGHSAWEAQDISILLPLPENGEEEWLLQPSSGRTLLPRKVFDELPPVVTDVDIESLYRQSLRVIAVRIDPCFNGNGGCQKQLRLVWQPLVKENGVWLMLDGAIHTFYEISDAQWKKLLKEWPASKASLPLAVHSVLKKEGYTGPYWKKLSKIILKYCSEDNLSRATAMTVNPLGNLWVFMGFDIVNGQPSNMMIPRLDAGNQTIMAALLPQSSQEFAAVMNPAPMDSLPFLKLLRNSSVGLKNMEEKEIRAAVDEAFSLENPKMTNPGTVDCTSCHIAHVIPTWARRKFPQWNWQQDFPQSYEGGENVQPSYGSANVLRAFGYFNTTPVISRRVTHETKEALNQLNSTKEDL